MIAGMSGQGAIRGEPITWAKVRWWDEAEFRYREAIEHIVGHDMRHAYLTQVHEPPLVYVVWVRLEDGLPREEERPCAFA